MVDRSRRREGTDLRLGVTSLLTITLLWSCGSQRPSLAEQPPGSGGSCGQAADASCSGGSSGGAGMGGDTSSVGGAPGSIGGAPGSVGGAPGSVGGAPGSVGGAPGSGGISATGG